MKSLVYRKSSTPIKRLIGCLVVLTVCLVVWEWGVRALHVATYILPPPSAIFSAAILYRETLLRNLLITASEAALGLLITTTLGIALAILFQTYSKANEFGMPFVAGLQSFPKEAIAPLLVVWFGFGLTSKMILAAAIAFFPVFISTLRGLKSVPHDVLFTFTALRATPRQTLWKCRIPFALPHAFSGIRVASTLSIVGAVIGEFIGSSGGLGHLMLSANSQFSVDLVFASLVLLGAFGLILDTILSFTEKHLIPWHESITEINYIIKKK